MELSRHWRLQPQRYRLVGEICDVGHKIFPPRDVCPECSRPDQKSYEFPSEALGPGIIYNAEQDLGSNGRAARPIISPARVET